MVRTQIQLTEIQAQKLKIESSVRGESIAELIRRSVDLFLENTKDQKKEMTATRQRAKLAVGQFHSGVPDLGRHHDHYLVDAFSDGRYQDKVNEE